MARGVNKVILVGTVGKDIELRHIPPSNDAVCNVSIATNEEWKDKNTGQKQTRTEWHRVSAFKQQAEFLSKYAKKGTVIYVEGSLRTKKITGKDGKDTYQTDIKANEVQILSGGRDSGQPQGQASQPAGGFDEHDWDNS